MIPITRFDANISKGILYTVKEHRMTDILIGLHKNSDQNEFLGQTAEHILENIPETIYIYKPVQPFNTLKRMVVLVTPDAELEAGFLHWFIKVSNIAKSAGMPVSFYAAADTLLEMEQAAAAMKNTPKMLFNEFSDWADFLIFSRELKPNDLFMIVSSRKMYLSYHEQLGKLPYYLSKYFEGNSFIILYPKQVNSAIAAEEIQAFGSDNVDRNVPTSGFINRLAHTLKRFLTKYPAPKI